MFDTPFKKLLFWIYISYLCCDESLTISVVDPKRLLQLLLHLLLVILYHEPGGNGAEVDEGELPCPRLIHLDNNLVNQLFSWIGLMFLRTVLIVSIFTYWFNSDYFFLQPVQKSVFFFNYIRMRRKIIDNYRLKYLNDLFDINLIFSDPSRISKLSEFAWTLRSSV